MWDRGTQNGGGAWGRGGVGKGEEQKKIVYPAQEAY